MPGRRLAVVIAVLALAQSADAGPRGEFLDAHCVACHAGADAKGGLKLDELPAALDQPETFARWVKVFDRVRAGEMPPKPKKRPPAADAFLANLEADLTKADAARVARDGRTRVRRLNRVEFENTIRDLLGLPGLRLLPDLPADGRSHGFDRSADALDFSFVHAEAYLAAVDRALDEATPAFADKPPAARFRYTPWNYVRPDGKRASEMSFAVLMMQANYVPLVGLEPAPPVEVDRNYTVRGEPTATAVGLFRHEDADNRLSMFTLTPVLTGRHTVRVSAYSFGWDGKRVVPTDRGGAVGLGIHSTGEHFGTRGVPANAAGVAAFDVWLRRHPGHTHGVDNYLRVILASCENVRDYAPSPAPGGPANPAPGLAVEWVEIEGPFFDRWPPASQTALFGDLPVRAWTAGPKPAQQTWPAGRPAGMPKDTYGPAGSKRTPVEVVSANPEADAARLLRAFLTRAFRRPVGDDELAPYRATVAARLAAGDHFQDALKVAYRAALASPDLLLLGTRNDDHAMAAKLSYFLWAGPPDDALAARAGTGELAKPDVVRNEAERLLADPRAARFVESFTGQWLRLREIEANAPDKQLYPEFMPWLQESMANETRAYFTELLTRDLGVAHFVKSDFAMLNEPLARHYGVPGVSGFDIRKVPLPKGSARGGFLTQGAVLKVTANGTTTSPVPRGAFVLEKILGVVPTPPPADAGSIEPDTRGATTVRAQLDTHKRNAACAACHAKMDPYGFALERFDVTGRERTAYRARGGIGDHTKRPFVNNRAIEYHDSLSVDSSGTLPDGRAFKDIVELRDMLAADEAALARAFVGYLVAYATGTPVGFADRAEVERVLERAKPSGYGVRTLLLETVSSPLFLRR